MDVDHPLLKHYSFVLQPVSCRYMKKSVKSYYYSLIIGRPLAL
jgi:hypothetical protein